MAHQTLTIESLFETGHQHHCAGRLADAERVYRQLLSQQPDHVSALQLLGVIAYQRGSDEAAVELLRRAIALHPNYADAHNNLANALTRLGKLAEAAAAYRRAIECNPNFAEAWTNLANVLARQGATGEAIAAYRRAIQLNPQNAGVHYNLANALTAAGKSDEAAAELLESIRIKPDYAEAYNNLGALFANRGNLEQAAIACRRAIALKPKFSDAFNNLGIVLNAMGKGVEAVEAYQQAIACNAANASAYNNMGVALKELRRSIEAAAAFNKAIEINPRYAGALTNLGNILAAMDRTDEARTAFARALQLEPGNAEIHYNLGTVLKDAELYEPAIESLSRAVELRPGYAEALGNLGNIAKDLGKFDEAGSFYQRAIAGNPRVAEPHNNFAILLKDQGLVEGALASHDRAVQAAPSNASFASNRLYLLHFHPRFDARALYDEHRKWNRAYAEPLKRFIRPPANSRLPDRPLKIGYLSPDFRLHPVGRFMAPLLERHDSRQFQIYCYNDARLPADAMTARIRKCAQVWRDVPKLLDEELAELIRRDEIDILVDLTMHMAFNRMLTFARKPAPVQVTYLAYCSTTGLDAIDYRFTDAHFDPPAESAGESPSSQEQIYSEKSVRLDSYWCYEPSADVPPVGSLPALGSGKITFGCLNNFCKASPAALETWFQILQQTPESGLLLHSEAGSHRSRVQELASRNGIDPSRIRFVAKQPLKEYFNLYSQIDIALDPFPCAGGTTSFDALWMGVPIVSLSGATAVSRAGSTILHGLNLRHLLARDVDQYIAIARKLASNLSELGALRAELRPRLATSRMTDAPHFARNVESAYRQMWRTWCAS